MLLTQLMHLGVDFQNIFFGSKHIGLNCVFCCFGISNSALNSSYKTQFISLIISEPGTEMLIQLNILTGHNYTAPTGVSGQWNQCKYP